MPDKNNTNPVFQDRQWRYSYKTSSIGPNGQPINILHDFYIPALKRSVSYDRVAGYFRSSSLAAASQGFSAFSAAGGKMRLIVGADMNSADVTAILDGDQQRLTDRLSQELADSDAWPEDVANGVALLAWMVARGHLTVRVAFRIHRETGAPLSFDNVEDGYVHEKWGVFTDAAGDHILMSGSLNESRTALVHNAENIVLNTDWWGESDRHRIDEEIQSFETLWSGHIPYIKVLSLPEAISQRLIQMGQKLVHPKEIDGTSAISPAIPPPSALERLKFAVIKDGPKLPGGRYVGMETAPVKPWPHQEVVARRLIQTWPYSYLLCDEVGLGKTIETGLAIRSLYLSGLVQRVLIAPPASLTQQWHREMATKCLLPFARVVGGPQVRHEFILPEERTYPGGGLYDPDLAIVSTGLISRKQRQAELKGAKKFDLALVDEAHYARRKNPGNGERSAPEYGLLFNTIANQLTKKSQALWLATATPMQLDWIEVFDLIYLTDRTAHFQYDPSLTWTYYQALGKLVHSQQMKNHDWELLRRAISLLQRFDPFLWQFIEKAVIDGTIRTTARRWLDHGVLPKGTDHRNISRLVFAAAPLSRVMLRHTRPLLEIYKKNKQLGAKLPQREILPVPQIVLRGLEKTAYDTLEDYCRDLTQQIAANQEGQQWRTSLGFYLSFLRLRLASSLFALRETLKRRREKVIATLAHVETNIDDDSDLETQDRLFGDNEDVDNMVIERFLRNRSGADLAWEQTRLTEMLAPLNDLSDMPLKMQELLSVLEQRRQPGCRFMQTVIFTRFYDTLTDIVDRLHKIDSSMRIGTYSGRGGQYVDATICRLRNVNREDIRHRFSRQEIDVLVCTDAAAEGLNLQTADLIINYDLPWNPMKVEQRIGRIDRIGQSHDRVFVLNLCYLNSAEQIVYDRLLNRLAQAGDIVGTQQISLLPVTEEEFEQLATGELDEETLWHRAQERIQQQRQHTESMEIPASELYDIYLRLKSSQHSSPASVVLSDIYNALIESDYLQSLGGFLSDDKKYFVIQGLTNVSAQTALTVDRDLHEQGLPGNPQPLHFASYGEPVFEKILATINDFDLPKCAIRISESVPDTQAEIVGYAVACKNEDGKSQVRLIRSYTELKSIILDEEYDLQETDLIAVKEQLHQLMREEFDPTRSIDNILHSNLQAGKAQRTLNLMIALQLFPRVGETEQDNFFQAVNYWDEQVLATRDQLQVSQIPIPSLEKIKEDLLVDIHVPQTGDTASPTVPIFLVASAINEAYRLAESLKERRSDVTIAKVKRRIKRELAHLQGLA